MAKAASQYKVLSGSLFKHLDTTRELKFTFTDPDTGYPIRPHNQHKYVAKIANSTGYIGDRPVSVLGSTFTVKTSDLKDLGVGDYALEIWETYTDSDGNEQTGIYPSPTSFVPFSISSNVSDKTGEQIKQIGVQDVIDKAVISAGQNLQIGDTVVGPAGSKPSVKQTYQDGKNILTFTLPAAGSSSTGAATDLSDYYTKEQADEKYALKSDVKEPDLSQYALKSDIKAPDLSSYETKADSDTKLASKADLAALGDYTKTADLQELIKSAIASNPVQAQRYRPTAVRADFGDMTDPFFAFDNGAEMHFKGASGTQLGGAWGYGSGGTMQSFKTDQQIDNVMSYLNGYLILDKIKAAAATNFDVYKKVTVTNPLNDVDSYNWSAVKLTNGAPIAGAGELAFVKSWYAVGLLSDKQIESLGAVKK